MPSARAQIRLLISGGKDSSGECSALPRVLDLLSRAEAKVSHTYMAISEPIDVTLRRPFLNLR